MSFGGIGDDEINGQAVNAPNFYMLSGLSEEGTSDIAGVLHQIVTFLSLSNNANVDVILHQIVMSTNDNAIAATLKQRVD